MKTWNDIRICFSIQRGTKKTELNTKKRSCKIPKFIILDVCGRLVTGVKIRFRLEKFFFHIYTIVWTNNERDFLRHIRIILILKSAIKRINAYLRQLLVNVRWLRPVIFIIINRVTNRCVCILSKLNCCLFLISLYRNKWSNPIKISLLGLVENEKIE
jgi:hypothetical protein